MKRIIVNEDKYVDGLRLMAQNGCKPNEILKSLSKNDELKKMDLLILFMRAFNLELPEVSCILGWRSNELSDKQIDEFLIPAMNKYYETTEK